MSVDALLVVANDEFQPTGFFGSPQKLSEAAHGLGSAIGGNGQFEVRCCYAMGLSSTQAGVHGPKNRSRRGTHVR